VTEHDIHPQLLADCHYLGSLAATELLLHRNAALPWFILVPDTRLADVLDLPEEHRAAVLEDCAVISAFIKQVLGYAKVNFAGLGNQVPQMHLHIIGRREDDPCWPQPVWGRLPPGGSYSGERLAEFRDELAAMAGLRPAGAAARPS
jgi:diadenosine tetraphosphate (Ap4A) HIT family hydrolase